MPSSIISTHLDGVDELELHDRFHLQLVLRHHPARHPPVGRDAEEVQLLGLVVALPVNLGRQGMFDGHRVVTKWCGIVL